jgi:hypothetical protein
MLLIEMSASGVHSDDVVGVSRKGALEESIIWFVPDDAQFGEGIADTAAFDDFSNELWIVAEHISVFLENRRIAQASINPDRTSSKTSAETLFRSGKVAGFRTQVSRTTLKIRLSPTQHPRASLRFHECDSFLLGHGFIAVCSMRSSKRWREFEPNDFSLHHRGCMHHAS